MKQMRNLRNNRWALAIMALLLLLATSGITVSRMSCLISGHSELSLGIADDCCEEEEHAGATIEATCCDLDQAGTDRVDVLPASQTELLALPCTEFVSVLSACGSERVILHWLDSRPPPMRGVERLAWVGSFLI